MKKLYISVLIGLLSVGQAVADTGRAWTRDDIRKTSVKRGTILKAPAAQVVVEEDFSLFSAGSEAAPDGTMISDESNYVPDQWTKMPGWVGNGVYQAGGICMLGDCLDYYGDPTFGFISTPLMDLYGTVKLTFRARAMEGTSTGLWVAFCDDYYGPIEDKDFSLATEWKDFVFTSTEGSFEDPCNFQFSAENGKVLLDDIRIERTIDRIPAPSGMPAVNKSLTEFEARWEPTEAPEHLLSVYYKEKPANPKKETVTQNFDGIKLNADGKTIDATAPNYPEGWIISVSDGGDTDMTTAEGTYNSAPQAVVLDAKDDRIMSAPTALPIKSFKFWIRPSAINENSWSLISVRIYGDDGAKVEHIANIPSNWLEANGGWYEFKGDQIGEGYNQVEICYEQKEDDTTFAIDDLIIECEEQPTNKYVVEDLPVEGNSYTVRDIDPEKDYYYYVRARDGEVVSDTSYPVWVDGLTGLKVKALAASDVTATGFTANWERMPHAESYMVSVCNVVNADEPMSGVTVVSENFDKITEGTPEQPGSDWANVNLGERGMANSGWVLTNPAWAAGMAGTNGTTWYGTAGLVVSPRLSLSNNGGTFTVEASVYATCDKIPGTEDPEEIFVMLLDEITDPQAKFALSIVCKNTGLNHDKLTFSGVGCDNVLVAFMSKSGQRFFVDDVTITQDLLAGESFVSLPVASATTEACSHKFEGLDENIDHGYTVVAKRNKDFTDYVTDPSDLVTVESASGVEDEIVDGSTSTVTVYNLQGIRVLHRADKTALDTLPRGIYIVNGKKVFLK